MDFISVTNRSQLNLAEDLDFIAEKIEAQIPDIQATDPKLAAQWFVAYIRKTAETFREAVASRPDSFLDRTVAIFGLELDLLNSLQESQWLLISNYTTPEKE